MCSVCWWFPSYGGSSIGVLCPGSLTCGFAHAFTFFCLMICLIIAVTMCVECRKQWKSNKQYLIHPTTWTTNLIHPNYNRNDKFDSFHNMDDKLDSSHNRNHRMRNEWKSITTSKNLNKYKWRINEQICVIQVRESITYRTSCGCCRVRKLLLCFVHYILEIYITMYQIVD